MTLIRPFRALRPVPTRAREVIAPPYDVLSSAEARERAKGKPWSFLHVSKAEIDLPAGIDPYAPAVYAKAAENLERMRTEGVLMRDANPYYYAYRATWTGGRQTGLACVASLADYGTNRIQQARADDAGERGRPRAPDRGGQRPDRPRMMAYPHAPELDRTLEARHRARPGCQRHRRRRRPPRAVGDRRCRRDRAPHRQVRGAARALHRRWPPPLGRGSSRRRRRAAASRGRTATS